MYHLATLTMKKQLSRLSFWPQVGNIFHSSGKAKTTKDQATSQTTVYKTHRLRRQIWSMTFLIFAAGALFCNSHFSSLTLFGWEILYINHCQKLCILKARVLRILGVVIIRISNTAILCGWEMSGTPDTYSFQRMTRLYGYIRIRILNPTQSQSYTKLKLPSELAMQAVSYAIFQYKVLSFTLQNYFTFPINFGHRKIYARQKFNE